MFGPAVEILTRVFSTETSCEHSAYSHEGRMVKTLDMDRSKEYHGGIDCTFEVDRRMQQWESTGLTARN